ncbi:MAG: hypothetical protein JWN91_1248 [Nocardioides sp.]|jgi:hypothetical protein|nr:hypothetical protein [Nocardioides sp.]
MRRLTYVASAAALLFTVGACSDSDPTADPEPTGSPATSSAPASTPPSSPTTSPTEPAGPGLPEGGTADAPAPVTPEDALLDWQPVPGPVRDSVTRNGSGWSLTVTRSGGNYSLDGPTGSSGGVSSGTRVSDALIDDDWAVVVLQDKAEQRPSSAEVTDLATGKSFTIDGRSDVPTTTGGTWALGDDRVLYATYGPGRAYCLASLDLATQKSTLGWCAEKRHGFNGAHITPAGDALQSFDDSAPACRTLVSVSGDQATPFEGVPDCSGWDGQVTDDGAVWSVIPKENQVENAHLYARVGDGYYDLGPGTSGTLTWCGGASYFVRDPQREGDPAALMRWSADDGLAVVYESPGGQAFLGDPRCGGSTMTVTALAEDGDEQVTAALS